jgi:hypothetical protein
MQLFFCKVSHEWLFFNKAIARVQIFSTVNPYSLIITLPGADAPNVLMLIASPLSPV